MYLSLCYITCPTGFYGSVLTQLCLSCHSSCLTCSGPFINNCQSCPTSGSGTPVLLQGTCYSTCPTFTYSATCLLCDSSCLSCSGPSATNCLSCAAPMFFHLNFTSCVSSCAKGEISSNYNLTCVKCLSGQTAYFEQCQSCNPTCLECYGITFLECSSCNSFSFLVQSTCVMAGNTRAIYAPTLSSNSLYNALVTVVIVFFVFSFLI